MEGRGLTVEGNDRAKRYLEQISYYRLSAYVLPLQQVKDRFTPGTTFDQLLNLYLFDRELRLLVFDEIERIEVAVRAQAIYRLSHKYGSHWQDDPNVFLPAYVNRGGITVDIFNETQAVIQEHCTSKRPETFVEHYRATYSSPANPPSWMSMELLTMGQLSRLFAGLKDNADKSGISTYFGLHHNVMTSWLHTMTYVRNICAHHSRLWNRDFGVRPDLLMKPSKPWMTTSFRRNNHRCFYFLCTLKYLLFAANPTNHFRDRLEALFRKFQDVPVRFLGIPTDRAGNHIAWQNEPLWQA